LYCGYPSHKGIYGAAFTTFHLTATFKELALIPTSALLSFSSYLQHILIKGGVQSAQNALLHFWKLLNMDSVGAKST
jgi:hypothetical protein